VIDFNPSVFNKLSSQNVSALLGDVLDDEIIEKANLKNAKAVICTVPNVEENINLLNIIKTLREKPMFIGSSIDKQDATKLYETGADYVLDPDIIAGEFLRHLFLSHGINKKRIVRMGKSHFNRLLFGKIYA